VTGPAETPRTRNPSRERSGFALPLVLFGLICVSLLTATALITASSESASSTAHQQATAELYATEAALEAYLADETQDLERAAGVDELIYEPRDSPPVRLAVVRLASLPRPDGSRRDVYAVSARSTRGGRMLSVVVTDSVPDPRHPLLRLAAAVTVARDLVVGPGDARIDANSDGCEAAGASAIRLSVDGRLDLGAGGLQQPEAAGYSPGEFGIEGAVSRSGAPEELVRDVLGTDDLRALAGTVPRDLWLDGSRAPASSRWLREVLAHPGAVVVVDAGGEVFSLEGGSYAGLLILLNGDVRLADTITYDGVILVEGTFQLRGEIALRGALLSVGRAVGGRPERPSEIGPGARITFDGCSVESAGRAFRELDARARRHELRRVGSWMEMVR
jgi:hypothetical protein